MTTPPPVSPWLGLVGTLIALNVVAAVALVDAVVRGDESAWLLLALSELVILFRINRRLVVRALAAWRRRTRASRWVYPLGTLAVLLVWAWELV